MRKIVHSLQDLNLLMQEVPGFDLGRLSVGRDDNTLVYDTKHIAGERCWLMRNGKEQRDVYRFNNWQVGLVVNRWIKDAVAVNPQAKWGAVELKEWYNNVAPFQLSNSQLSNNHTELHLNAVCQDVKQECLPVFETKLWQGRTRDTIVPTYVALRGGPLLELKASDRFYSIDVDGDNQTTASLVDLQNRTKRDGTNPTHMLASAGPNRQTQEEIMRNKVIPELQERLGVTPCVNVTYQRRNGRKEQMTIKAAPNETPGKEIFVQEQPDGTDVIVQPKRARVKVLPRYPSEPQNLQFTNTTPPKMTATQSELAKRWGGRAWKST